MSSELEPVFGKLRAILKAHASGLHVSRDGPAHYGLEAAPGPATLRAWRGKLKRPRIPVAWVSIEKRYVSYHLMGLGDPKVVARMSPALAARMQGKTCFNFTALDAALTAELEALTGRGLGAFRAAGFIADGESA